MVEEGRISDLARLHTLAARVDALDAVRAAWKAYLQQAGSAIVMDEEKDKEMIKSLLALKSKVRGWVGGCEIVCGLRECVRRFVCV